MVSWLRSIVRVELVLETRTAMIVAAENRGIGQHRFFLHACIMQRILQSRPLSCRKPAGRPSMLSWILEDDITTPKDLSDRRRADSQNHDRSINCGFRSSFALTLLLYIINRGTIASYNFFISMHRKPFYILRELVGGLKL